MVRAAYFLVSLSYVTRAYGTVPYLLRRRLGVDLRYVVQPLGRGRPAPVAAPLWAATAGNRIPYGDEGCAASACWAD